jgi:hypothetical protein
MIPPGFIARSVIIALPGFIARPVLIALPGFIARTVLINRRLNFCQQKAGRF